MKIKNTVTENTCATELDLTLKGEVIGKMKLYWSANSGIYGHQICGQFWDWREGVPLENSFTEFKTGGCGYCKESNALGQFMHLITDGKAFDAGGELRYYLGGTKYHLGGNYYKIPLSVLKRKLKRGG